jgi:integrase
MYWSGWRRNETLSRQWRHVDMDAGTIRLEPGENKSGKGRTLPFNAAPVLRELLECQRVYTRAVERRTGQIVPWVFHREGRQIKSIRQGWRTACEKVGLIGKIPHDFRRSAIRNMVRAGIPEKVAMAITGHETRSVFERYNIVAGADLHDAMGKLAAYHDARTARVGRKAHLRTPKTLKRAKPPEILRALRWRRGESNPACPASQQ